MPCYSRNTNVPPLGNHRAIPWGQRLFCAGQQHPKCTAAGVPACSEHVVRRWKWQQRICHAFAAQQLFPAFVQPVFQPAVRQSGTGSDEVQGNNFCANAVMIPRNKIF